MLGLYAAVAVAGLATAVAGLVVALSRIDFAWPSTSEVIAACARWVLPHGDLASILVVGLAAMGVAALAVTAQAAARRLRATWRFERELLVVGRLTGHPGVRLIDDPAPHAFCAGLARPRVYLSTGAVQLLSAAERDAVLAHEAHHARRRDPLRLLVARSVADGLFFLPAAGRLAERYAALAELAADEAAVRRPRGRRALASALLTFDSHPHPGVVGIAPERVDRLLGERPRWQLPLMLLVAAAVTLVVLAAGTLRLAQVTGQASIGLPQLMAQACMAAMAFLPIVAGAVAVLGGRRILRTR